MKQTPAKQQAAQATPPPAAAVPEPTANEQELSNSPGNDSPQYSAATDDGLGEANAGFCFVPLEEDDEATVPAVTLFGSSMGLTSPMPRRTASPSSPSAVDMPAFASFEQHSEVSAMLLASPIPMGTPQAAAAPTMQPLITFTPEAELAVASAAPTPGAAAPIEFTPSALAMGYGNPQADTPTVLLGFTPQPAALEFPTVGAAAATPVAIPSLSPFVPSGAAARQTNASSGRALKSFLTPAAEKAAQQASAAKAPMTTTGLPKASARLAAKTLSARKGPATPAAKTATPATPTPQPALTPLACSPVLVASPPLAAVAAMSTPAAAVSCPESTQAETRALQDRAAAFNTDTPHPVSGRTLGAVAPSRAAAAPVAASAASKRVSISTPLRVKPVSAAPASSKAFVRTPHPKSGRTPAPQPEEAMDEGEGAASSEGLALDLEDNPCMASPAPAAGARVTAIDLDMSKLALGEWADEEDEELLDGQALQAPASPLVVELAQEAALSPVRIESLPILDVVRGACWRP